MTRGMKQHQQENQTPIYHLEIPMNRTIVFNVHVKTISETLLVLLPSRACITADHRMQVQ